LALLRLLAAVTQSIAATLRAPKVIISLQSRRQNEALRAR